MELLTSIQFRDIAGRARACARAVFGFLASAGRRKKSRPGRLPSGQFRTSEYHLTARQVRRVIDAANSGRDRALIRLLAETGLRRAEAANVRIEDIRWTEMMIVIPRGKGGKTRIVPITRELSADLRAVVVGRVEGFAFEGYNAGPLGLRQVNRIVADTGRLAGVRHPDPRRDQLSCHLFRHTFARLWKDAQGSIESLSKILGHRSVKTTWDLYGNESLGDVKRNYETVMGHISKANSGLLVQRNSSKGG